jgi:FMN-dependent NADH-azoreductase
MEKSLLVLNAEYRPESSKTRKLTDCFLDSWTEKNLAATVTRRDLSKLTFFPDTAYWEARERNDVSATSLGSQAVVFSQELIAELLASTHVVLSAPMYNFSVAHTLKAWFDFVIEVDKTFAFTSDGLVGLLEGQRVLTISTSGGFYKSDQDRSFDHHIPYLRKQFEFLGIRDFSAIRAEGQDYGDPKEAALSLQEARRALQALAQNW